MKFHIILEENITTKIANHTARKKYVKLLLSLKYSQKLYQINKTKREENKQSGKSLFTKSRVFVPETHKYISQILVIGGVYFIIINLSSKGKEFIFLFKSSSFLNFCFSKKYFLKNFHTKKCKISHQKSQSKAKKSNV